MTKARQMRAVAGNGDGSAHKRLLEISRQVSATIGNEFFHAIAKHLARALGADCVVVAEFAGGQMERYRSVGAWFAGAAADFEYELAGSAMAQVVLGKPCSWRSHARNHFPSDELLQTIGAEACIAVPLPADGTHPIGALMAIYRPPLENVRFPKAMLDVFAGRAAGELQRKAQEEKVLESDERYKAFISKNPDAMWRVEFEKPIPLDLSEEEQFKRIYRYGYLAEANDALARMLGMESADQLIGSRIDELASCTDPSIREATMLAIRAGYNFTLAEINRVDPSGRRRCLLRSQWGIIENENLQRIWGSNRDITDLRQAEMALDAAEQRMADFVESMHLFVVFVDLKGSIEFCNNYLFQTTGWAPEELIGKNWLATLIPEAERRPVADELKRNTPDLAVHFESSLMTKSGSLQLEWDCTVLRNSDGMPTARALVGRNITDRKALQAQVLQTEKLAGIGRLAGGLAHDFNNLLTVILGYTARLLEGLNASDPAFSSLMQIQKAGERSAQLAHRLLTFSRRELFRPQVLDLNGLIEEMRGLLDSAAGEEVKIILNFEPELRPVRVDPHQFQQLLLNLASNARDAMPNGGLLTVATANFDVGEDEPQAMGVAPGQYVLLSIADTGAGMTEDVKSHLFEPFFSTKPKGQGTGLGLAMVYGIVQQSFGYVRVDSVERRGTTFRIFLPQAKQAGIEQRSSIHPGLPHGTETVLLVGEPRSSRVVAATALAELGYSVLRAEGPLDAIELAVKKSSIQLMISPAETHGMPGEVLLQTLTESQPNIKGLFLPGGKGASIATDSGATFDFLPRRFSLKDLAFKVREVLDR